jgi:Cdc6-like AAA superfamily ATPase
VHPIWHIDFFERKFELTPLPRPITANPLYQKLQIAERTARNIYERKFNAAIICGPPDMGKTTILKKLQQEYDEDVIFVRPSSNRGLIDLLSNHQDAGILVLDDVDHLWGHQQTLSTLKVAFDTRSPRILRHDLR